MKEKMTFSGILVKHLGAMFCDVWWMVGGGLRDFAALTSLSLEQFVREGIRALTPWFRHLELASHV